MTSTITDLTVFENAVRAATRAPSVHNTQPWRFVVAPPYVELYLDRARVLAVADADAREARLSCGAALLNLRVAVRAAGRGVLADLLPDPTEPDLLARVRIAGPHPVPPELRALAAAIDLRTTNRRPFTDRPVSAPHRAALVRAARAEGRTWSCWTPRGASRRSRRCCVMPIALRRTTGPTGRSCSPGPRRAATRTACLRPLVARGRSATPC